MCVCVCVCVCVSVCLCVYVCIISSITTFTGFTLILFYAQEK